MCRVNFLKDSPVSDFLRFAQNGPNIRQSKLGFWTYLYVSHSEWGFYKPLSCLSSLIFLIVQFNVMVWLFAHKAIFMCEAYTNSGPEEAEVLILMLMETAKPREVLWSTGEMYPSLKVSFFFSIWNLCSNLSDIKMMFLSIWQSPPTFYMLHGLWTNASIPEIF